MTGGVSHRRTGLAIGPEIFGALDRKDRSQSDAGTVDPALDRADGAPADLCRFFVGKSGGADQDEGFALLSRQLFQRPAELFHFQVIDLIWQQCQCFRIGSINILYLAAPLERPEPAFLISKLYQRATVSALVSQALFFERNAVQRKELAS